MRVLIVDTAPLLYQIDNTRVGEFSIQEGPRRGEPTGIRYGLIRNIAAYQRDTASAKVVLAWDLPGQVRKAVDIPEYKSNRTFTSKKASMYAQVGDAKELIKKTAWTQVEAPGYEADDVAGSVARKLESQGHEIYICSTDNDFCQCVSSQIKIWVPGKKPVKRGIKAQLEAGEQMEHVKDVAWVKDKFGVHPKALLAFRAINGDVSDNLAGVPGLMGHAALQSMLNTIYTIYADYPDLGTADGLIGALRKHQWALTKDQADAFRRNWNVMALAQPESYEITKGTADAEALTKEMETLEFKSLLKLVPQLVGKS